VILFVGIDSVRKKSGEPTPGQQITCAPPQSSTITLKQRPRSV
jgi:hypothetical protein